MKYQDYTDNNTHEKWINGKYVGVTNGKLKDSADPTNDGFNHLRDTEHMGTVAQDSLQGNEATPVTE